MELNNQEKTLNKEKPAFASPNFHIPKSQLERKEGSNLVITKLEQAQQFRNDLFDTKDFEEKIKKVAGRDLIK